MKGSFTGIMAYSASVTPKRDTISALSYGFAFFPPFGGFPGVFFIDGFASSLSDPPNSDSSSIFLTFAYAALYYFD
jgi:hypothetical protein